VEASDLARWSREQREAGRTVVFTNGCFDLLHGGHVSSLLQAAELGDVLLVAINDDASVRRLKGKGRPVQDQETRALVLRALRAVSAVTIFADLTSLPTIESVRPDVLAKGGEYSEEEIVGAREVLSWGGRVARLSMVPGAATTQLVERMRGKPREGSSPGKEDR